MALIGVGLALLALLAYSLDRTAWLFAAFEVGQKNGEWLGLAAAVVVEIAVVALVLAESVSAHTEIGRWSGYGLAAALAFQALANLLAGYLRGGALLASLAVGSWAGYAVAATVWLVSNLLIPALIFFLAKIAAHLVPLWRTAPVTAPAVTQPASANDAPASVVRRRAPLVVARMARRASGPPVVRRSLVERAPVVALPAPVEMLQIGAASYPRTALVAQFGEGVADAPSVRQFATLVGVAEATVRRKLAQAVV
jgi:hypothetical protein